MDMTTERMIHTRPARSIPLEPGMVRRMREDAGRTISDLAAEAGISKQHLAGIERGEEGASPPVALAIATALGVTIPDLRARERTPASEDDHAATPDR